MAIKEKTSSDVDLVKETGAPDLEDLSRFNQGQQDWIKQHVYIFSEQHAYDAGYPTMIPGVGSISDRKTFLEKLPELREKFLYPKIREFEAQNESRKG